jgi:DNA-directed RNA polymerase subunit E'/Rpb7
MTQQKQSNMISNIYNSVFLSRTVEFKVSQLNNNYKLQILNTLRKSLEGKCCEEGYIKPGSVDIQEISCGCLNNSSIKFYIGFRCDMCRPVEGQMVSCIVDNITKAGIKCKIPEKHSPLLIFIARDHNYNIGQFNEVEENDSLLVKIIGIRFELNDPFISVIASLDQKEKKSNKSLNIGDIVDSNEITLGQDGDIQENNNKELQVDVVQKYGKYPSPPPFAPINLEEESLNKNKSPLEEGEVDESEYELEEGKEDVEPELEDGEIYEQGESLEEKQKANIPEESLSVLKSEDKEDLQESKKGSNDLESPPSSHLD